MHCRRTIAAALARKPAVVVRTAAWQDASYYVINASGGEKISRKGGPGITHSDLLFIKKADLAPYVGASLTVMHDDTKRMRGEKPFVMTNLRLQRGLDEIIAFIEQRGLMLREKSIG